ncbi:hypothetical protein PVL29_022600 [Vitis rotundifolia]|uniref:Bidirectional sugar transporter SWEET n=1 Tax=Vitis rotundifolia TaxID=103349 RepID=A0AA39DB72_VITRO|nr:hypothetical protein PVL29_022600 [Vitis rotundifolia]
MVSKDTARTIVGIIGNIISFCLFASPIPTFKKIYHEKTVGGFKPDPYLATVASCCLWVIYGLPFVHPDSTLVLTINAIGLVMEIIYVSIFFTYSDWAKRKKTLMALVCIVIFVAAVAGITMGAFHSHDDRSMFVGILAVVFNIIMYASPLTVMRRVIRTRSVKYMPFFLSLANLMNGIVWLIYALIKIDAFIVIPNALGTISGLVQMVLYATFYKSTPREEEEVKKPQEVQLSGV